MSHSTLVLFTRAAPHTKSKRLLIDVQFYSYTFYPRSATYKNQGAPVQRPILLLYFYTCGVVYKKQEAPNQNIILLFIHIHLRRMKSEGHIYIRY
jgi:hypothetical protein